jgi:hypothetical protein
MKPLLLILAFALTACDVADDAPDAAPLRAAVWDCPCAVTCGGVTAPWMPPRVCTVGDVAEAEAEGEQACLEEFHKRGCGAAACACSCSLTEPLATCSP